LDNHQRIYYQPDDYQFRVIPLQIWYDSRLVRLLGRPVPGLVRTILALRL